MEGVLQELGAFRRRRGKADQVEMDPTQQSFRSSVRAGVKSALREFGGDKGVDGIA